MRTHALALLLLPLLALAEQPLPSTADVQNAQQRARDALSGLPDDAAIRGRFAGQILPKTELLPKTEAPTPDIAAIAEKYKYISGQAKPDESNPGVDLMVFVSFSMPREALVRAAQQAERAGATLVFRGLKGDSMAKMGEEVGKLIGNMNVSVAIHPPAFEQFSISKVPAVVLARREAADVLENGCALPETYVKVAGDVTLDYALEYIERNSAVWSDWAKYYRSKIVRGIQ